MSKQSNILKVLFLAPIITTLIAVSTFFWGKRIGEANTEYSNYAFQEYGILRIPILEGCQINTDDLLDSSIISADIIGFNTYVRGSNTKSFLKIQHTGAPSNALNHVGMVMQGCVPNSIGEYTNSSDLASDLRNIYMNGLDESPIYIVIEGGKATVLFQDTIQ